MKAYEVIEKYGWRRGLMGNEDQGFCALGALIFAYSGDEVRLAGQLHHHLAKVGRSGIIDWNDARETTKEDVIATLKELDI